MWIKSRRCDTGHCVEVWPGSTSVWVRDSTAAGVVPVLSVDRATWRTFTAELHAGKWDR